MNMLYRVNGYILRGNEITFLKEYPRFAEAIDEQSRVRRPGAVTWLEQKYRNEPWGRISNTTTG